MEVEVHFLSRIGLTYELILASETSSVAKTKETGLRLVSI